VDVEVRSITFSRTFKLSISLVFISVCAVGDALRDLFGVRRRGYCVVLYYHAVATKHRTLFSRQMDILLRLTTPIPANSVKIPQPGEKFAAITFDDGLENIIENALPELKARQIPSTVFIVPESLGRAPIWMDIPSGSTNVPRVMSREQLLNLDPSLVTVGSHSLTHPNLTRVGIAEATRQISDSRTALREMLDREVSLFSFPYGAFNDELIKCCRETGYERVFTSLPSLALTNPGEFALGRISVEPTDWALEFRLKLLGAYRWLPGAIALKRRLRTFWRRSPPELRNR
jgi:peptidoglycan/xylan/chitin deacetylase (PgdA/CDA1 family)